MSTTTLADAVAAIRAFDQGGVGYRGNRYRAEVLRVVDGDTLILRVDLGQHVHVQDSYRLFGIDAPETALRKGVTEEEKAAGRALKDELMWALAGTSSRQVWVATEKAGKYGRWLVVVWAPNAMLELPDKSGQAPLGTAMSLNEWLLLHDRAAPYLP